MRAGAELSCSSPNPQCPVPTTGYTTPAQCMKGGGHGARALDMVSFGWDSMLVAFLSRSLFSWEVRAWILLPGELTHQTLGACWFRDASCQVITL